MDPSYAAFSKGEHRFRLAAARESLRREGLSTCIVMSPDNLFFLSGFDSWVKFVPQALVLSASNEEPTLVVRDVDLNLALETSWFRDIRTYSIHRDNPLDVIASVVREKASPAVSVGLELQSDSITYAIGRDLEAALAPAKLSDATETIGSLRLVKSAAELGYIETAGHYASAGLEAARRALKAGVTEATLVTEIELAMRRAGSEYWSIPAELSSGERTAGGHATPRERAIADGDIVHMEFAGVARRYHAVAVHTMALGAPNARANDVYRLARESLDEGLRAVRPGALPEDVEAASLRPLQREGMESKAMMMFGNGIGIAYPPIWLESLVVTKRCKQPLGIGMAFVLHSCIELIDEKIGVKQGGTYILEQTGLRMIAGGGVRELDVVGR